MVVNPKNGPGGKTVDSNVKLGVAALAALKLIGYVHQGYGSRAYNAIQKDLNMWATWKNLNMYGVKIQGVFYDEMPDDAENKQAHVKYVGKTNAMARTIANFTFIIQNPGTIPDQAYFGLTGVKAMDVTIILEDTYDTYTSDPSAYSIGVDPSKLSIVINSVPASDNTAASYTSAVQPMLTQARHLFLTDLSEDFYENWGANWVSFVAGMASTS